MYNIATGSPILGRGGEGYNNPKALNNATFLDYYNRLKLLATTIFEWKGLPDSINLRFLENTLFQYGQAVYAEDPNLGPLVAKVTVSGKLNHYDEPVSYHAYGVEYDRNFAATDCVLIRNNPLRAATHTTIELFARRLAEAERAMDVNIKGQKYPVVLVGSNSQILTLKNVYAQYDGNAPVIYADKSLDLEGIKAIKTDSPFVADKLMAYKHDVWNDALTFLGINNANTDKRERLITDEVTANDQMIEVAAEVMLATRREACEAIRKLYGVNCSVSMKQFQATAPVEQPDRSEAGKDGEE